MQLYYCEVEIGNFGDDMNAWFWDDFFPEHRQIYNDVAMFGIGSILWKKNLQLFPRILVMGSGTGVGVVPKQFPASLRYAWVRGPMSADLLGIPGDSAVTDPASLVCRSPRFTANGSTRRSRLFIPHVGTATLQLDWKKVAMGAELEYLSPSTDSIEVIKRISEAELVVTESLHGAIVANSFGVPWVPLAISPKFSNFKWVDWGKSVGIDLEVRSALDLPKRLYSRLRDLRSAIARSPKAGSDLESEGSSVRSPNAEVSDRRKTYKLRKDEKGEVRKFVSRLSGLAELALERDLRSAIRSKPYLSERGMLEDLHDEMQSRIDDIRSGRKHFEW